MTASDPLPLALQKFIRLEVDEELSNQQTKRWFEIVNTYGPQNVVSSVTTIKPKGGSTDVMLVHRKTTNGKHFYDIPLKRDFLEKEVKIIVEQWKSEFEDDFAIEVSQIDINAQKASLDDAIVVKDESYEKLCEAIAKSQHIVWMNERVARGWRYGEEFDRNGKTHPMIKPWHELPDEYRAIDDKTPQVFIKELNKMGFSVVKTSDLEEIDP